MGFTNDYVSYLLLNTEEVKSSLIIGWPPFVSIWGMSGIIQVL